MLSGDRKKAQVEKYGEELGPMFGNKLWPARARIRGIAFISLFLALFMIAFYAVLSSRSYSFFDGTAGGILVLAFAVCIASSFVIAVMSFVSSRSEKAFQTTYTLFRVMLNISGILNLLCLFLLFRVDIDRAYVIPLAGVAIAWSLLFVIHSERVRLKQISEAEALSFENKEA